MIIKGKSDKREFRIHIPLDELLEFMERVINRCEQEFDDETATSPGGLPTAIFTSIIPHTAREAVGWDIHTDRWDLEKAMKAFEYRLERKSGGGFNLEARQVAWDVKAAGLIAAGLKPEDFIGKRPQAK